MEPDEEEYWMRRALLLGGGGNRPITACDPTAHAEIRALRAAATSAGDDWLSGSALYVILESCLMCTGALVHARVSRLVFTARDNLGQGVGTVEELLALPWLNHRVLSTPTQDVPFSPV